MQDESPNNLIRRLNLSELHQLSGANSAIFFVETNPMLESFFSQPECAFESAALRNPGRPVIVLQDASARMAAFSRHLVKVDNLHFVKVDFKEITEGTVLEVSNGNTSTFEQYLTI